jgi:hypothetical protein
MNHGAAQLRALFQLQRDLLPWPQGHWLPVTVKQLVKVFFFLLHLRGWKTNWNWHFNPMMLRPSFVVPKNKPFFRFRLLLFRRKTALRTIKPRTFHSSNHPDVYRLNP